jgi:hypothetical protein
MNGTTGSTLGEGLLLAAAGFPSSLPLPAGGEGEEQNRGSGRWWWCGA